MAGLEKVRAEILKLIANISPLDSIENAHKDDAIEWVKSGVEIFRIEKPDIPPKHIVSYFLPFDSEKKKILLTDHKKSGLLLPAGGHVEPGENPRTAAKRELSEELFIDNPEFLFNGFPIFISQAVTVGQNFHTDVSLWFVVGYDSTEEIRYDEREFKGVNWFSFDEIPYDKADPHMERFVQKLKNALENQN